MREIKFRAWDRIEEKMKGVSVIHFGDDGSALTLLFDGAPRREFGDNLVHGESGILMQSTGLTDKNGKEIYEGDIVQIGQYMIAHYLAKFQRGAFVIILGDETSRDLGNYAEPSVIGNIYETPELLMPSAEQ